MKHRMYTHTIVSFVVGILITLFQEAYIMMNTEIVFGFTPMHYFYLLMFAFVCAVLIEVWNTLLPYIIPFDRWTYVILCILNLSLWLLPFYTSIFYLLYMGYISIVFAFQLFTYKETNLALKNTQERL